MRYVFTDHIFIHELKNISICHPAGIYAVAWQSCIYHRIDAYGINMPPAACLWRGKSPGELKFAHDMYHPKDLYAQTTSSPFIYYHSFVWKRYLNFCNIFFIHPSIHPAAPDREGWLFDKVEETGWVVDKFLNAVLKNSNITLCRHAIARKRMSSRPPLTGKQGTLLLLI